MSTNIRAMGRGPGRPPVLEQIERRQAILVAAEQVFVAHGYADASIAEIARVAGMSKKTIYTLFEGKRALFQAFAQDDEALRAALAPRPDLDGLGQLQDSFRRTLTFALSQRQLCITRILVSEANTDHGIVDVFFGQVVGHAQQHHAEMIASLLRAAERPEHNVLIVARTAFSIVMGDLHIRALMGHIPGDIEAQIDHNIALAMLFVRCALEGGI